MIQPPQLHSKSQTMISGSVILSPADPPPGTIKLCGVGDEVWGSINHFDSGQIVINDMGEDIAFKNAGTTAIALGSKIVGATRTVNSVVVYGYVKAFASAADAAGTTEVQIEAGIDAAIAAAIKARGTVVDGGGTSTSGKDAAGRCQSRF